VSAAFSFNVTARSGRARRGRMTLAHGVVETPAFMPVGTQGAVKGVTLDQVAALDASIILANTYHLHVRPGRRSHRARRGAARVHGLDASHPHRTRAASRSSVWLAAASCAKTA
jgi:queuine tRNA-ribosyltransferase